MLSPLQKRLSGIGDVRNSARADPRSGISGVSMLELRASRVAEKLKFRNGPYLLARENSVRTFRRYLVLGSHWMFPLMDTTIYLDYLAQRCCGIGRQKSRRTNHSRVWKRSDLSSIVVINCTGIGSESLGFRR
jgi:hypothetical protein